MQLGFGTAWFGKIPLLQRERRIGDLFGICQEAGIDYIDTAHSYFWGFAEGLVSAGIRRSRGWEPAVTTKIGLQLFDDLAGRQEAFAGEGIDTSDPDFKFPKRVARDLKKSLRRLRPALPSAVLLHNPPRIVSQNRQTWLAFRQLADSFGITNVGISIDRAFSKADLPEGVDIPVIQVTAKDFVAQNDLFASSAAVSNATVIVHRVIELSHDFTSGLSLLANQKRRPDIALVGTTKPERLHQIVDHWHTLKESSPND